VATHKNGPDNDRCDDRDDSGSEPVPVKIATTLTNAARVEIRTCSDGADLLVVTDAFGDEVARIRPTKGKCIAVELGEVGQKSSKVNLGVLTYLSRLFEIKVREVGK
jgi:hypothetical protein